MEISHGGNVIQKLSIGQAGKHFFAHDNSYYSYYRYHAKPGEVFFEPELAHYCIYLLPNSIGQLRTQDGVTVIQPGDVWIVDQASQKMVVEGQGVVFLVAGISRALPLQKKAQHIAAEKIKRVKKPWGFELWVSGEHPGFCLKDIFISKGTRTSLQYHREKKETNILMDGTARLFFKSNPDIANDHVTPRDLGSIDIQPITSIDIVPNTLHRLEAISDIRLCETSTPHLDDVVRIADDANRKDGRIETEHK